MSRMIDSIVVLSTWLTSVDAAVLGLLDDSRMFLPPKVIMVNLEYRDRGASHTQIKRRLWKLDDAGLVKKSKDGYGYYAITDKGRKVISGQLSRQEVNDIEPED